jgi:hypothetical protein
MIIMIFPPLSNFLPRGEREDWESHLSTFDKLSGSIFDPDLRPRGEVEPPEEGVRGKSSRT